MRRLLSFALAALLIIICLADIAVWIRGYTTGDTLLYSWRRRPQGFCFLQLWTESGGLRLMSGEEFIPSASEPQLLSWNQGLQHGFYSGVTYPYDKSSEGRSHRLLGFEFW